MESLAFYTVSRQQRIIILKIAAMIETYITSCCYPLYPGRPNGCIRISLDLTLIVSKQSMNLAYNSQRSQI